MKEFLELNRRKLWLIPIRVLRITMCIALAVIIVLTVVKREIPSLDQILPIVTGVGLALPMLSLIFMPLAGLLDRQKQSILRRTPFNELDQLGFVSFLTYETSKWELTQEIKVSKIKGFDVSCDIEKGRIKFTAPVEWRPIEVDRVAERLKLYNIEMIPGGLVKHYNPKNPNVNTILELKRDLEEFIDLLKQEGLEPKKKLDWTDLW